MSTERTPSVTVDNGVTVVALGPAYESLEERDLDTLRDVMLDVSNTADPPLVVLDLSHTRFFGSAFIEVLFRLWNRLEKRDGGRFAIAGLTEYCQEILAVTHLDKLWKTYPTCAEAVAALCEKS